MMNPTHGLSGPPHVRLGIAIAAVMAACSGVTTDSCGACTIGVAGPAATSDGRPLLWKTRDKPVYTENQVQFCSDPEWPYTFISVCDAADTLSYMGVNEHGFAIVNAYSQDLTDAVRYNNGWLIHYALGHCATVADFSFLLDSTNVLNERETYGNFGIIDAFGTACMFEVSDTFFWRYNANDENQCPDGVIVRTNFSLQGGGTQGIERFTRSSDLIGDFCRGDSLNYRTIARYHMRDFSDEASNPVSVPFPEQWDPTSPFGYIMCELSICRSKTQSAVVIQGVRPRTSEPGYLTTMWTVLGQPATAIFVPYWPVGPPPSQATGFSPPLSAIATEIRSLLFDFANPDYLDSYKLLTEDRIGLWSMSFAAEDVVMEVADSLVDEWRSSGVSFATVLEAEAQLAEHALIHLGLARDLLTTPGAPGSVRVEVAGGDAVLTWEPVTRSVLTTPLAVDGYSVSICSAPGGYGTYSFLGFTPDTTFVHYGVAAFQPMMYYRVQALKG